MWKTKILLIFWVLLLTANPAHAVNIVDFNIVTPNGTPELSGMFSIDFDDPNFTPSSVTLMLATVTFDTSFNIVFDGTFIVLDNGQDKLELFAENPATWGVGGGSLDYSTEGANVDCGERCTGNALYVPKTGAPVIPEPATLMLLSTGLVGLVGYRWRQRRREGQDIG